MELNTPNIEYISIKIAGKDVTLAYCFGSEVSYKLLTDEEIYPFINEAIVAINDKPPHMPDLRKTIFLIIACAMTYYESKGQKSPIEDKDLIYHASPDDIGRAIGTIAGLYIDFYKIPVGEPDEPKKRPSRKRKNA